MSTPAQLAADARLAVQNAIGKAGAAVLVLPGDVLAADAAGEAPEQRPGHRAGRWPRADPAAIHELAERLERRRKVAIFGGIGCADARDEVLALAGTLQAPVGHTLRGKDVLQYDNPYDVGMTGLLGYGACYQSLHEADLVLLLGTDFPYDEFLPQQNTVQIDIDPARLGRRTPLVQGLAADVGATLRALLPLLRERTDRSFLDTMLRKTERQPRAQRGRLHAPTPSSRPRSTRSTWPRLLDELAATDAVFTVDTGMCCTWAARYLTPNGRRRILGSFVHGSMANALPMAIGAQIAAPGPAGDLVLRRRRAGHAARRAAHRQDAPAAGEGGGVQQLQPRHGPAGDAGRG